MAECGFEVDIECRNKDEALRLKGGAIVTIMVASTLGMVIPILGKKTQFLRADGNPFLVAKAFSAGVILATGFVHILGEASERLTSECLPENPWHKFPWTGFIAMMAVFLTLVVDAVGTEYYERKYGFSMGHAHGKSAAVESLEKYTDSRQTDQLELQLAQTEDESARLRHVVISQVLELGIIAHSVIIGISLGVSDSPCSIRPLFAALVFHQFFEGIALGGCVVQACFKVLPSFLMTCFFAATTPFGIGLGIGISSSYNENSQTALIVQGVFDAVAAGILIYMALVDLIAHDFLGPRMRGNRRLQAMCYTALFGGAGAMAALAVWA